MEKEIRPGLEEVVLAAFFHDIGKLIQRAGAVRYRSDQERVLCPYHSQGNYYSHQHVLYTDGFLTQQKDVFPHGLKRDAIVNLAAKHHQPDTAYEWVIAVADWLSSGSDRMRKHGVETDKKYFEQPLLSIFSKVHFPERDAAIPHYHRLEPLSPETVFPVRELRVGKEDYHRLLEGFETDFQKLGNYSYPHFVEAADALLETYTWAIPSSTLDEPDISLYDHSRTTAALAAALYRFHHMDRTTPAPAEIQDMNQNKFLFVSGDLSGIQTYIFNLKTTRYNAKILRARSFEIQAMSDMVVKRLLSELGLPPFSQIMNAGGRFLLLLPNLPEVKETLRKWREKVETFCTERYFGELTLNLSEGVEASGKMLLQEHAVHLFGRIAQDVARSKQKKLQHYLSKQGPLLEKEYRRITGNQNVCPVCQQRAKAPGKDACAVCNGLIRFGEQIPKNQYLVWHNVQGVKGLEFFDGWKVTSFANLEDVPEIALPATVNRFQPGFPLVHLPYYVPYRDDQERTVKDFAEISQCAEGAQLLAMLKADVDNLGAVFSIGLERRVSLSRFTTLSRMLNYFFSTYLNHYLQQQERFRNIYTVFSGGDDLALIGPWDVMIDFAGEFMERFREFVGDNPSLSLSAGIALAGSKLPVRSMATMAEVLLEQSKTGEKDRITLFGIPMPWNDFRQAILAAKELVPLMREPTPPEKRLSTGQVYRLIEYGRRARGFMNGNTTPYNALWRSHLRYDAARNIRDPEQREWFLELVENNIGHIQVVASYALYKNRKKEGSR